MQRLFLGLAALLASAAMAHAEVPSFPAAFKTQEIATNGTTIHVRVGGSGPAVVLLHGYGETGDMWAPLAADLARDHTVIVPDLRGMGLSATATSGFDKKNQGHDIAGVLEALKVGQVAVVTHDIGNMVGYAFVMEDPKRTTRFVLIDAPVPGIGPWEEILKNPLLWHFRFGGPDMERLVAGRERIYLDRFYNELSFKPASITEETRQHYAALYARPGAMHSAFEQFKAFTQDAVDNKAFAAKGKLPMPVLAVGADHSFGERQAEVLGFVASDVTAKVLPDSGHWVMEEQPAATTAIITGFLD